MMVIGAACKSGSTGGTGGNSGGQTSSPPATDKIVKGGVYRTAIEDFGFTGAFDPTGEYLGTAQGLLGQLLMRNLVTYKHIRGVPATTSCRTSPPTTGDLSADGLTYTFHLKPGLKWGPPLSGPSPRRTSRSRSSGSIRGRAGGAVRLLLRRHHRGHGRGRRKKAGDIKISGIETPDDNTIVFHLSSPPETSCTAWRCRRPLHAARGGGSASTGPGDYGRDIVSRPGPYMIKGMDQVDATPRAPPSSRPRGSTPRSS